MAVVVILVIIIAIAIPNFSSSSEKRKTKQNTYVEKTVLSAGKLYFNSDSTGKNLYKVSVAVLIGNDYLDADDIKGHDT